LNHESVSNLGAIRQLYFIHNCTMKLTNKSKLGIFTIINFRAVRRIVLYIQTTAL